MGTKLGSHLTQNPFKEPSQSSTWSLEICSIFTGTRTGLKWIRKVSCDMALLVGGDLLILLDTGLIDDADEAGN